MPNAKPKWVRQRVLRLYRELESTAKTAERFNETHDEMSVSQSWVWGVCDEAGVITDRVPTYPGWLKDRAQELINQGLTERAVTDRLAEETEHSPSHQWVHMHVDGTEARNYEYRGRRTFTYDGTEIELRGRHTIETCIQVLEEYEEGRPTAWISEDHDMPRSTIEKLVERAGVSRSYSEARINWLVQNGKMNPIARRRRVETLYVDEELSTPVISDRLDVPQSVIQKDLRARGVELRSRAEALIVSHWGSVQTYKEFCRDAYKMVEIKDLPKKRVCDKYDVCYRTVRHAVERWPHFLNADSPHEVFA